MEDHALAKAFPGIRQATVRIARLRNNIETSSGTGYIVGCLRKTNRVVIVTAGHVLAFADERPEPGDQIRIQKFAQDGAVRRSLTFDNDTAKLPDIGSHIRIDRAPGADVALFVAPRYADDKQDFAEADDMKAPPPVVDRSGPDIATRIAWAGFPGLLQKQFGIPKLCYFEGVISTWVRHLDRWVVVIDGHALPGVSGGPVWFYHDELRQVRVAGLISSYFSYERAGKGAIPGFVFVQPINDLMEYALRLGRE